jgi:hypothetical protein
MKKAICLILLITPVITYAYNLVGGKYSNVGDGAVARARGATSIWINPAGLAFEKSSSISSGASAYNYRYSQEGDKKSFSSSSTTSHVAAVSEFETYILGFMLYTPFNQTSISKNSNDIKNSEGYSQGSSAYNRLDITQNYYLFAFSPKKANWGLSLNIVQTSYSVLQRQNSHNYSSTPSKRKNKVSTIEVDDKFFMAGLEFGQQLALSDSFKFGYKLTTPTYLIIGGGSIQYDSLEVNGTDANNSVVTQANFNIKKKTIDYYESERLRFGIAYYYEDYIFELDIAYSGGYRRKKEKQLNDGDVYQWISTSDNYLEGNQGVDTASGTGDHNSASIKLSTEYIVNDDENFGFSIGYAPTDTKSGKGTNKFTATTGYSKKYKNFLGSYGVYYIKGIDTGKNTTTDDNTGVTKRSTEEFETISFMVSGSYYF